MNLCNFGMEKRLNLRKSGTGNRKPWIWGRGLGDWRRDKRLKNALRKNIFWENV